MINETTYGKLVCEASRRDYIISKVVGIIFAIVFSILLILLAIVGIIDFVAGKNTNPITISFIVVILIFGTFVVRYIFLHEASSQRFRIYENGISPHIRPLRFYLKRLEYFIPLDEFEKIEISKTTDGGKCIVLHPKNWKEIVVESCDSGVIVFNKLLELSNKNSKRP